MNLPVWFSHENNCIYDDSGNKVLRVVSLEASDTLANVVPALNGYREAVEDNLNLQAENQRLRDLLRKAVDTIQYDGTGISLRSNIWDMLNEIEKALQQEGGGE